MAIEIERKFLVLDDSFKKQASKIISIKQGYLTTGNNSTVRVRITDGTGVITIKSKIEKNSFSRYEWEYKIPHKDAEELIKLSVSGLIEKKRYIIPYYGFLYEVDVFHGDNEGLIIAEIELTSESDILETPSWLGKEVTKNKRYYNAFIARKPYKKWKKANK